MATVFQELNPNSVAMKRYPAHFDEQHGDVRPYRPMLGPRQAQQRADYVAAGVGGPVSKICPSLRHTGCCRVGRALVGRVVNSSIAALLALADRILEPLRHADEDLVACLAARDAGLDLGIALGAEHRGLSALTGGPATTFTALLSTGNG
jgi:hypothetical protein